MGARFNILRAYGIMPAMLPLNVLRATLPCTAISHDPHEKAEEPDRRMLQKPRPGTSLAGILFAHDLKGRAELGLETSAEYCA
jgi:hypothetical protein